MAKSPRGAGEQENQSCWEHLTTCEKTLLFLLIFTLTALVSLLIFTAIYLLNSNNVCHSTTCIENAAQLLSSIDNSIDPCEDFAKFVCGNPTVRDSENIATQIELKKYELVSSDITESDSEILRTIKNCYRICSNSTVIEANADHVLLSILQEIGGWPLLLGQEWNDSKFTWLDFMTELRNHKIKNEWLMRFDSYQDTNRTNYLMISPPDLKVIFDERKLLYLDTMVQVAAKLGSSVEIAWQELKKVISFENELALVSERIKNSNKDTAPVKMSLISLNEFLPTYNLVTVFNNMSRGYTVFTQHTPVYIQYDGFIYELNRLLMKTPKRTIANYMVWKIIESYLPFCSDNLRKTYENYAEIGSRDEFCFKETLQTFGEIIDAEYLSHYLNKDITQDLKAMTNMVKGDVLEGEFESRDTELAILGFHRPYLEYENLRIHSDSYNILEIVNEVYYYIENNFYSCLNRHHKKCIKKRYSIVDQASEPIFSNADNTIYLPSRLIHDEWYEIERPHYLNYARLGKIMGDLFIQELNKMNSSYFSDEPEVPVGIDLAYKGYLQWTNENGMEKRLPGINYSTKEIFWIAAISPYCNTENGTEIIEEIAQSQYRKNEFRCK